MSDPASIGAFLVAVVALFAWAREMVDHARTRRILRHTQRALDSTLDRAREDAKYRAMLPLPERIPIRSPSEAMHARMNGAALWRASRNASGLDDANDGSK